MWKQTAQLTKLTSISLIARISLTLGIGFMIKVTSELGATFLRCASAEMDQCKDIVSQLPRKGGDE